MALLRSLQASLLVSLQLMRDSGVTSTHILCRCASFMGMSKMKIIYKTMAAIVGIHRVTARNIGALSLMQGLSSIASLAQASTVQLTDATGVFTAFGTGLSETLNGSGMTSALTMLGGGAGYSTAMIGGSGNDQFIAGVGSDTFTGGAGSNIFAIGASASNAGSHYIISDFNINDSLYVGGTTSALGLLATATSAGGNITLTLSNGATVTFSNLSSTDSLIRNILVDSSLLPNISPSPLALTASGYTVFGTPLGTIKTPVADFITGGSSGLLAVSGNSVSGLAITASGTGGFVVHTAAGDILGGQIGSETITSTAGILTLSGAMSGQAITVGANTNTITGTATSLNLDVITNLSANDQIVVKGASFSALKYDSTTGVLQLDTSGNGSFATTIDLSPNLLGMFVATPSANYTTVSFWSIGDPVPPDWISGPGGGTVPEPSSPALLSIAGIALALTQRRRRQGQPEVQ